MDFFMSESIAISLALEWKIKLSLVKNCDQSVEINDNPNWPYIRDHPYRILITGGSESVKTNKTSRIKYWQSLFELQITI